MAPAIVNATLLVNNPQISMIAIMEKNDLQTAYGTKYSRMDQVKFVEDSL